MRNLIKRISDFWRSLPLATDHRPLTTTRRGSVLILVVVLCVLLALMGTALLSTTRNDRYVAVQNSANTEVDMLVEGVKQIAIATITDSNNRFDKQNPAGAQNWNWDMPYVADGIPNTAATEHDLWLSPRLPEGIETSGGAITQVMWPTVGILPVSIPNLPHFDDPIGGGTYSIRANQGAHERPIFSVDNSGPKWQFVSNGPSYHAADADGDGIADSGYFVLPVGQLDGVTYYAAMRIIDNNSAVNVNTAQSAQSDFDFTSTWNQTGALGDTWSATANNLGVFRSHIGLKEMLSDYDPNWANIAKNKQFVALTSYRNYGIGSTAYDDNGTVITDNGSQVTFLTRGDLLDHQLADRLLNPGCIDASKTRIQSFAPSSDAQAALAYHFTLANLSGGKSSLESALANAGAGTLDSVYQSAMNVNSTYASKAKGRKSYPSGGYADWFAENFNFANLPGAVPDAPRPAKTVQRANGFIHPLRAILTTYNPVSNQIVPKYNSSGTLPDTIMPPYRTSATTPSGAPVKTNINTAAFPELYRAFWCVMADNLGAGGTGTPFVPTTPATGPFQGMGFINDLAGSTHDPSPSPFDPQYMFRPTIRDPRASGAIAMAASDQLLIRAASAAAQTLALRNYFASNPAPLPAINLTSISAQARVFPMSPQPFIVEVFVYEEKFTAPGNGGFNAAPYVAIKLFNPFSVPVTLDSTCRIAYITRLANSWPGQIRPQSINYVNRTGFSPPITIAPGDYYLIDNVGSPIIGDPSGGVTQRPGDSGIMADPDGPHYQPIQGLENVIDSEMMIVKGPVADPTATQVLDSYDFTGFNKNAITNANSGTAGAAWHYARAHDLAANRWRCVYPGRYDGSINPAVGSEAGLKMPRQQGTQYTTWASTGGSQWQNGSQGFTLDQPTRDNSTYANPFSIQLDFNQLPGDQSGGPQAPNAGPNGGKGKFPFGGFMRNGDILQVPYIAACNIFSGTTLIEANSIAMDAAFAEDSDPTDDVPQTGPPNPPAGMQEQVGRFCPLTIMTSTVGGLVNDFDTTTTNPSPNRYMWAKRLFDYLTVQSPGTDYMPNDPAAIAAAVTGGTGGPTPVDNDGDGVAGQEDPGTGTYPPGNTIGKEDTVGVQGLININTAPWKVLAAIPWVPKGQHHYLCQGYNFGYPGQAQADANHPGMDDNDEIAMAIVKWRDGDPSPALSGQPHGPFKSFFDLLAIHFQDQTAGNADKYLFQTVQQDLATSGEPGVAQGDFSVAQPTPTAPSTGGPDGIRGDFKEQYLLLNRVSNLLTTRSDTFTVYILLQGWRGIGGTKPTKVVERRAAMIVDRTGFTQDGGKPASGRQWRWDLSND